MFSLMQDPHPPVFQDMFFGDRFHEFHIQTIIGQVDRLFRHRTEGTLGSANGFVKDCYEQRLRTLVQHRENSEVLWVANNDCLRNIL